MGRDVTLDKVRNIGIMAHIDAGKTTFTERVLFHTGIIHKTQETHDGGAQMDWMDQEKERGITITSAATTAMWNDHRINIIDTPGHVDFTIEVQRSLRVLDGAICVLDSMGVQPQTETVWRQATDFKVPRMIFVNKMDRIGADYAFAVDSVEKRIGVKAFPIAWPIGAEDEFKGFVDILDRKAYEFEGDSHETNKEIEIPADLVDLIEVKRTELIEEAANFDDKLMEDYLEGKELAMADIKAAIRKGVVSAQLFLTMCGSAKSNIGIKFALDRTLDYMPAPTDVDAIECIEVKTGKDVQRAPSDNEPFTALAFKIAVDPFVGSLTFFRVYSGKLTSGSYVMNSTKGERERIGRILQMHANNRKEISEVYTGEIAAAVGLKSTTTADTLCEEKNPVIMKGMDFPEPVIDIAIEPKSKADQDKMGTSLQRLADEDPTFRFKTDVETGQTVISGMGELHLEVQVERMRREFNVDCNVGRPQVAYRETLTVASDCEGKYIKQSGGRGQHGHVWIKFEPNPGNGYEFVDKIVGGVVPKEYIPAVDKGLQDALAGGILAGYPMVDVKATLFEGSYHDVDSSEMAFKIAASMALKEAKNKCKPVLLEPIMKVDVDVPEEYMGNVMGDLTSRRGKPLGQESKGTALTISAMVPLSEMFGYATSLRSNTQGRGTFQMFRDHYEEVPKSIAEEIVKKNSVN